ncbi:efflux RND transporter periplasmic adaptor subunit [Rubellimicrobium rubrum]|uniref:Efflux RND transporter periplasmic adaptor subunit n=1 Tax=Rubellimicrobium rubrum TaxID=2585369 RepID=A0A5C4MXY7_9RHOB|nr:efflux RND transporter periplasmic adaptor subunit [Rubellimicrobium rubrum]TNC50488.1 efflux RND transporter periplasmic adaptor subunit [Rubellimicrobium rubrum]
MAKDLSDVRAAEPPAKPDWAMSRREQAAAERVRQSLPKKRRIWPWVLLVVALAAVALGVWQWRQSQTTTAAGDAQPVAESETTRATQINRDEWTLVEPSTLRRTVKVIGTFQPSRRTDLSAETGGRVESVAVRPGDPVSEGQTLVQLDVERLTLEVELARSNAEATRSQLALAEDQLQRQQALVERGVAAETSVNELRTNVQALRANVAAQEDQIRAAELALEGATVRAPFSGIVASRSVEPGSVVAAGTPLLTIVDLSQMEMQASAPVGAGAQVRVGQTVEIGVDGIEGRIFQGTVARIAPVAQEGTRTLPVFVEVANDDGVLLGGMFGSGQIVTAEALDAVAVPVAAVREEGGTHVLLVEGEALARRDVTPVEEWPGGLLQVEGLEGGERVVTTALEGLEPGEAIELVDF